MLTEKLDDYISSADEPGCIAWIKSIAASEKNQLLVHAKKRLVMETDYDAKKRLSENSLQTLTAAVFGLAPIAELIKLQWRLRLYNDRDIELIKAFEFDREKINALVLKSYESSENTHFMFGYRKYKLGLCDRPTHEHYVFRLIWAFAHTDYPSLKHALLEHKDILEIEFWQLFELEGSADCNLAGSEIYSNLNWTQTILELCEEGYLPRERLLEASIDALDKDFVAKRAGWFSRFHEALKPSIEERTKYQGRYLHLFGSQNAPTVSFALKSIMLLSKHIDIDINALEGALPPVMFAKSKATVTNTLKLLKKLLVKHPERSSSFCTLAIDALTHENADVQSAVIDFIESFGNKSDESLITAISNSYELVNPSQQNRLHIWIADTETFNEMKDVTSDQSFAVVSTDPFGNYLKIESLDELVQVMGKHLESPEQPEVFEAILNAAIHYYQESQDSLKARLQPYHKRAHHFLSKHYDYPAQQLIAGMIISLLDDQNHINEPLLELPKRNKSYHSEQVLSFNELCVSHTNHAVELCLTGSHSFLLASPTHGRGFVCPNELIKRYQHNSKHQVEIPLSEMVLAIFRLDTRITLDQSKLPQKQDDEFLQCILYACGIDVDISKVEQKSNRKNNVFRAAANLLKSGISNGDSSNKSTIPLWVAASRSRDKDAIDVIAKEHFKINAPDFFEPAKYNVDFKKFTNSDGDYSWWWLVMDIEPSMTIKPNIHFVPSLFHQVTEPYSLAYDDLFQRTDFATRWAATIWPSNMTPYFACALRMFSPSENTNWSWKCLFEPMLSSDVEMDDMAIALLLVGLAGYTPCQKGMAIESAIQTITEKRLPLAKSACWLSTLMTSNYVIPKRWVKTLGEIANVSTMHEHYVRELITNALQFDPIDSPAGLGNILEFVYELYVKTNETVNSDVAKRFFEANKKGGKQGKFAKLLLKL